MIYILAGILALTMCFAVIIACSSALFGFIGAVLSTVILISGISYHFYFVNFRDHVKLSKILPEWVIFRKICSHLDNYNDALCLKLLESYDKNLAWEYAKYYLNFYEKEHENLLKELELLKRSKEKDKDDKIDIIRGIFADQYDNFSTILTEKMEEEISLKHQDFTEKFKSYFDKR